MNQQPANILIPIKNTLVSDNVAFTQFVCNLNKCKGACCVEGEMGAPLDDEERHILEDIYEDVKPFLTEEGIEAIEKQGKYVLDEDNDFSTTLIERNTACAYVTYDEKGITKCGIEKAFEAGKIDYQKPISCHLYPIRITKYTSFDAINYDEWDICTAACSFGKELKVPVYKFLKTPLIRKYGTEWYDELATFIETELL
ncbi:Protein of unknown function (DUF3109) [Bernardetia litoralis DSM 6794]|uniref:DUF3109 family protein n=1 Tax=Bernardetia litoralis (strain ATCC 23117 / DSM 6794 / NBRC 15988 / NCIMB 1366 / Fx l1 / Sio-4) TaxID=880071 RepID=I4AR01_BERLS|nr:Protein of unknown function (DUF3109) [Bernardetia litoralis DSM 6794]